MPTHRQHKGLFDDDHQDGYLTASQTRHGSKLVHDDSNSILLALATTLPMSCFPIENVPASARYGALEGPPRIVRNNPGSLKKTRKVHSDDHRSMFLKPESTRPGTEMLRMDSVSHAANTGFEKCNVTSYASPEGVGGYGIGDVSVFNTASPLSTSTNSSAWISELSSTEPTSDLGTAALVHTILPTSVDGSYPNMPYKSSSFTNGLNFVSDVDIGFSWNEVPQSNDDFSSSTKAFPSFENQMPALHPNPALPFAYPDRQLSQTRSPFKIPTLSPVTISRTNLSVQQSTPQLSNDYSPTDTSSIQTNKEVDDFLDDLSDMINWDAVNCPTSNLEFVQNGITNTPDANSVSRTPLPDHCNHQLQDPSLSDTLTVDETLWWDEFLTQAKKSASLFQMLNEQYDGPPMEQ